MKYDKFSRHDLFYLFIIYYLLKSKEIEISNEWISDKDIPGGVTFFRGPHKIPTHLISNRYSNNIKEFRKRCEQLQGIPLDMADTVGLEKRNYRKPVARYSTSFLSCLVVMFLAFGSVGAQEQWPHVVPSKDGTPISYGIYGAGEPSLVFVHGWSCDDRSIEKRFSSRKPAIR